MPEEKNSYHLEFSVGIFKINHMAAGFPDLKKIAEEWAKDENFKELIIRGVSETNYGIQFIYVSNDPEKTIMKYRTDLEKKFKDDFYAWDMHTPVITGDIKDPKIQKSIERTKSTIIKSEAVKI